MTARPDIDAIEARAAGARDGDTRTLLFFAMGTVDAMLALCAYVRELEAKGRAERARADFAVAVADEASKRASYSVDRAVTEARLAMQAHEEREAAEARVAVLETALTEAVNELEYFSPYVAEKRAVPATCTRLRAIATKETP